jgi:hypothetical protein
MKIHRWQPNGKTLCGRNSANLSTNIGFYRNDCVTCWTCRKMTARMSLPDEEWNGKSEGAADKRGLSFPISSYQFSKR